MDNNLIPFPGAPSPQTMTATDLDDVKMMIAILSEEVLLLSKNLQQLVRLLKNKV